MKNPRTDLAVEATRLSSRGGITRRERGEHFSVTEIELHDDRHMETAGKRKGRYITLASEDLGRTVPQFADMAQELGRELQALLPETGTVLVLGLGNREITPDALGPQAAARILATRHLRETLGAEDAFFASLRPVSVLAAGVLGQTGIEAAELTASLVKRLDAKAVIAIDALACAEMHRLGTTVQLSDTGIAPGSGVQNRRRELSEDTLGVPVIAVGVPTVVDLHTVAAELTDTAPKSDMPNLMVTPRNIDALTQNAAWLIACGAMAERTIASVKNARSCAPLTGSGRSSMKSMKS